MTTTAPVTDRSWGAINRASGSITGDGNPTLIPTGFTPKYFRFVNHTDGIIWEKMWADPTANAIKTTAGAAGACVVAIDTGSHIVFVGNGPTDGNGVGSITIDATVLPSGKVGAWEAWG